MVFIQEIIYFKIKDEAYMKYLDEYESIRNHRIDYKLEILLDWVY